MIVILLIMIIFLCTSIICLEEEKIFTLTANPEITGCDLQENIINLIFEGKIDGMKETETFDMNINDNKLTMKCSLGKYVKAEGGENIISCQHLILNYDIQQSGKIILPEKNPVDKSVLSFELKGWDEYVTNNNRTLELKDGCKINIRDELAKFKAVDNQKINGKIINGKKTFALSIKKNGNSNEIPNEIYLYPEKPKGIRINCTNDFSENKNVNFLSCIITNPGNYKIGNAIFSKKDYKTTDFFNLDGTNVLGTYQSVSDSFFIKNKFYLGIFLLIILI